MQSSSVRLSDFEIDVLTQFWEYGRLSAPELFRQIGASRGVTYSTIKTIVDRLEEKGAIRRVDTVGKTIIYRAAVGRDRVRKPLVRSFVQRLYGTDKKPLFAQLLQDEALTEDELEYLRQLIDQASRDQS